MTTVETRVMRIAEATLAEQRFVTPIDVLIGLGWLAQSNVDRWLRNYHVSSLDRCVAVDDVKTAAALDALRRWAHDHGLQAWETDYGDRLFTQVGDPATERIFRTRWARAEHPAPDTPRPKPAELRVMAAENAWTCVECGGSGDLLLKATGGGICLDCADLGHLVFLPAGDAALTRRARKASRLWAVVVRFNRMRQRFERHGILAENEAIELAARQCLADARAVRRERNQVHRVTSDEKLRDDLAAAIRHQFPGCPSGRADTIAYHAALRGSGRVGRRAAGRALDSEATRLAVTASVRHVDTDYDDLLVSGVERGEARHRVADRVRDILAAWREGHVDLDGTLG